MSEVSRKQSHGSLTDYFEKLGPICSRTSPQKKKTEEKSPVVLPAEAPIELPMDVDRPTPPDPLILRQPDPGNQKKRKRKRKKKKNKGKDETQQQESSGSIAISVDDSSQSSTGSDFLPENTSPRIPQTKCLPEEESPSPKKSNGGPVKKAEEKENQPKAKRTHSSKEGKGEYHPDKEWVIEAILKHRYEKNKIQYYIKWKDWPSDTNTWEPIEHMVNCEKMIEDYHEEHREKCVEYNKHFSTRPQDVGFGRGMKPEKILGFCDEFGEFSALIKWKSPPGGSNFIDLVTVDEVYEKAPEFMCSHIEAGINKYMSKKEEESDAADPSNSNNESESNESEEENDSEGSYGEVLPVNELKDPIILGNIVHQGQNYFKMKARKTNVHYLVPTKTAYKHYRKAVFVYFERNLTRTRS